MNNVNEICELLKEARLSKNLTSESVARQIGITRPTLSSIENGNASCSIKVFFKLLDFYNIDLKIDSRSINRINRQRATRITSIINKNINDFIVLCIEEYANSVKKSPRDVYHEMKNKDVIKELTDDFEDLHGMSTLYLNQYIGSLLGHQEKSK